MLPRTTSIALCAAAFLITAVAVEPLLAADPGPAAAAKKCKKKKGKRKKCKKAPPATVTPPATTTQTTPTTPVKYPLAVAAAPGGSVFSFPAGIDCGSDCTESYDSGQVVNLTASANFGYVFTGWSGDCTADPCSVTMNGPHAVTANFIAGKTLTVMIEDESLWDGSVTSSPEGISCTKTGSQISGNCSATFLTNTMVTLTAAMDTPFPADERIIWGDACAGTTSTDFSCGPLTMSDNRTVTIDFEVT